MRALQYIKNIWNSRKAKDREKHEKEKETSQNCMDKLLVNTA